jgi:multicomponent Na+:H+ antiporter subunit G
MSEVIADVLLCAGVLLLLMCAAGVLLMRSAYDRLHYASASGWGAVLVIAAVLARESLSLIGNKALVTGVALALTTPVLAHATARAARIRERGSWNPPQGTARARHRSG